MSGGLQLRGALLFLFIPAVLYLFVAHPRPIGASLAGGVALMVGHRCLARPYMLAARGRKCLWCNRTLATAATAPASSVEVATAAGPVAAAVCPAHRDPAARFLAFLARWAVPLRAAIFAPLLLLLAALAATAAGQAVPLPPTVALFQLLIGITVNVVAFAYPGAPAVPPARLPFPAHNFFLLGIRNLLWVLRLVGLWWIARGALGLLAAVT